ncbi:MAG: SpoVA/SpoVAEb family sporulation membrane protein [Christensenellaceae bacterium]|jgi:stage V sporulation protein AE|nr:SpoVA/SpoVAEb family sporulation membrane protein [Christensenellaceae bacterium]
MYLRVFAIGGLICVAGQLLLLYTRLGSAKVLVLFVTLGVFLSALGLYQPLADFAGAGATVPLTGFGHLLAKGAIKAVQEDGLAGALTGGTAAAAGGIAAAVALGYAAALIFTPKTKE